jgi:asparagine synthase (glutamine-hydrolysing)
MCGFVCVLQIHHDADRLRDRVLQLARRLRHRGPDWSGIYSDPTAIRWDASFAANPDPSGRAVKSVHVNPVG